MFKLTLAFFGIKITCSLLFIAYTSLLYFTAPSFPVQIIHLARNNRMICWREDFDARICGVLRKLVNVTGRNPDVIYPLHRR